MIFYLAADHPEPSWGLGLLYAHARLLRELGHPAFVLHHHAPFRAPWLDDETPLRYLDEPGFSAAASDTVVVPEVLASSASAERFPWRRVVFVQGAFLIAGGLDGAPDYPALGYRRAMAVMPHVARIVERHFGLAATVVPPFVAPYFFLPAGHQPPPRQRRVLLVEKEGYRRAGFPDQPLAAALLGREIARRPTWSLATLSGLSHREVAALMQTSTFLVNVHSHESFNATVPEAMAAGCIPICYDAFGARDYLSDGENAIVFPNHDLFALIERVCELIDAVDSAPAEPATLTRLRSGGRAAATGFSVERTAAALAGFFSAPEF